MADKELECNPGALVHTISMADVKWPPAYDITDEIASAFKRGYWKLIDDVLDRFIPAGIEGQNAKAGYLLDCGFHMTKGANPQGLTTYRLRVGKRIVGEFRVECDMTGGDIRVVFEPLADYRWARKKFSK